MQRAYHDMAGSYFLPAEDVTLASLGVPPYSPPDETWQSDERMPQSAANEYPDQSANADRFAGTAANQFGAMRLAAYQPAAPGAAVSFADMVGTIDPASEPGAWRDDNSVPFWIPDGSRALSGPSFDDFVRIIDPLGNPDVWRDDNIAPRYAGSEDSERYAVPYDSRAALGAFRIRGLPEGASRWDLRERPPAGLDDIAPILLASRWGRDLLAKVWKAVGGIPGGRRPDGPPASAPTGRQGYPLGSHRAPSRNPPGKLNDQPSSGHAFDKVQDEGLMPSVIDQARRHGSARPGNMPGTTRYYDKVNDVSVVVDDKTGRIITTHYGDRGF